MEITGLHAVDGTSSWVRYLASVHGKSLPLGPMLHRNADTLKRLQEAERKLKEQQKAAYVDMTACAREREAGNQVRLFRRPREARTHGHMSREANINSTGHAMFRLYGIMSADQLPSFLLVSAPPQHVPCLLPRAAGLCCWQMHAYTMGWAKITQRLEQHVAGGVHGD